MDEETARYLAERNRANLEAGLAKARRLVNMVNRGDRRRAAEATKAMLDELIRPLDDDSDARDQLIVNALTTAIQLQDQLNAIRAARGVRAQPPV